MIYYYKGGNNMADDVKLKLADAIKQLLSTKPLYKITIKEIYTQFYNIKFKT